jgi:BMFP domain-containing protein YqiC
MGRIKSALEIALERTESVKGDKSTINIYEAKQRGKKLANQYLGGELSSIEGEFKKAPSKEERDALKQGCFEIFVSQITLPAMPDDIKRLEATGTGLAVIVGDKRFSALYQQLMQALSQYMQEAAQYEEAIKRQYAPKLRQKEEELSRRMGQPVKLDPYQDPEFITFYNQAINALKGNYESVIEEVQSQIKEMSLN